MYNIGMEPSDDTQLVRRRWWVRPFESIGSHTVDIAFGLLTAAWVWYVFRLTRSIYFWSDDLRLLVQAGSVSDWLKPFHQALVLPSLALSRASADVGHLSFFLFRLQFVVFLAAVSVAYYVTTRRQFGAPLAAVLALPLLWVSNVNLRPSEVNHYLALAGAIVCAALLNRGPRADGLLAATLLFALAAGGVGIVAAGACAVHSIIVRAPWRRWLAIVAPTAIYGLWVVAYSPGSQRVPVTTTQAVEIVRDLFLAPFYEVGFGKWPLAAILVVAFFAWGAIQLRQGIRNGANFIAWTAAMVGWPLGLLYSRGADSHASVFRYAFVSLGLALLAVVPRQPITWPERLPVTSRRVLAVGALVVVAFGGLRADYARPSLRLGASIYADMGRKAEGTMEVAELGPGVIADNTPLPFFGFSNPHGTARDMRSLMTRYGTPFHATTTNIDQNLVDLGAVKSTVGALRRSVACEPMTGPVGLRPTSIGEDVLGQPPRGRPATGPRQYTLWAKAPVTIEVRRFGDHWVDLGTVPARRIVRLTLPVLASAKPWSVRADGACLIT
jgi:hypothetical protein